MIKNLFDSDMWNEIIFTITQQKLRSLMTMFGVFWGILLLVILVGCGFGMENGILGKLTNLSANSYFLVAHPTTLPYQGLEAERTWKIDNKDLVDLKNKAGKIFDFVAPVNIDGIREVSTGSMSGNYLLGGITPHYAKVIPQAAIYGRYINELDVRESRKVCMIGSRVSKELFGNENPCGKQISIESIKYTIIGVVKQTNNLLNIGLKPTDSILLPISTEQASMNRQNEYDIVTLAYQPAYNIKEYLPIITNVLKNNHHIHPEDNEALENVSCQDIFAGYKSIMIGIKLLIWIVGIGTLLAGIIGIANIMLVTIKERTQEIGVRRALGAMPEVIIRQIMLEGLLLTLTSGIAGITCGVWILMALNAMMSGGGGDFVLMERPMIPLFPALSALGILIAGGLLAGFIPASRAMKIKAIEALREE